MKSSDYSFMYEDACHGKNNECSQGCPWHPLLVPVCPTVSTLIPSVYKMKSRFKLIHHKLGLPAPPEDTNREFVVGIPAVAGPVGTRGRSESRQEWSC